MYNIFFCRFLADAKVSLDDVIDVLGAWINKSEYRAMLSISVDEFLRQPSPAYIAQKGDNDEEALLERIRWSDGKISYFGLRQTNPPRGDDDNLVWQSGCIFEQGATDSALYVFLNRGIQDSAKRFSLDITPSLPAVIAKLHDKNLISDATVLAKDKSCFPMVYIRQNQTGENRELYHELRRRRLHFVSHIEWMSKEGMPKGTDLLLCFPRFGICHSYERAPVFDSNEDDGRYMDMRMEHFLLPSDLELAAAVLSWNLFRLISETQEANWPAWDRLRLLCSGGWEMSIASSGKCHINAELLRQKRKELGLSQKELGERVGSSGLVVSRLETNQVLKASRGLVGNLEKVLRLSENSLVASAAGAVFSEAPEPLQKASVGEGMPSDSSAKMNYCRRCGTKLYQDSLFCHSCGTKVPNG